MAYRIDGLRLRALLGTAAIGALAMTSPAMAQNTTKPAPEKPQQSAGLDEIVVTAQRRAENLQEVPIAIAAVSSDTLSKAGVNETNTLSQVVPAVNFQRSGASGLFFVRGVGTTNASVGDEGSNAFYVDGVYIPDLSGTVTQFNNIERIEVLKGPQGTLFGRNAFGGLIHIITKEPGDFLEAQGEAGYANYQTVHGKLYVGGPITSNVSMDLALTGYNQNKGWGRNVTVGRDIKKMKYWGARSKLVWRASDAVKVTVAGDYYDMDDNTAIGWSIDEDFPSRGFTGPVYSIGSMDTAANDYSLTKLKTWGVSGTVEADLGAVSLTSISSVSDSKNVSDFDVDGGPLPWLRIAFTSGSRAYQQELRLTSNDTDPLSWQLGGFYLRSEVYNKSTFSGLGLSPLSGLYIDASLDTDSYAAFGEVSYKLTRTTTLTGGVRYTKDIRKLGGGQSPIVGTTMLPEIPTTGKISYGKFTWRAAIRQELTDDLSVYASYNRGFKAGTYSLQSPANAPVQPQYINAYEIGVKSELLDRRLRLNASVYHYDISNYQIRSAALSNLGSAVLLNAASVKVDGLDVEFEAAPVENLRIFGGFTWLDSRFDNFGAPGSSYQAPFIYPLPAVCDAPGTSEPGTTTGTPTGGFLTCLGDASGFQTPGAPDFTGSLGMSLTVPVRESGELRFNLLGSYNSGFPFESDGTLRQKKYGLLNGSVAYWLNENWGVELWGKNVTNTKYFQQKISTGLGATTARAAPATYGVTVKFTY
ncbi:TonB-dependent receptor [Novosphingobium mangrovi (ex Huang et al. 2023)]|uniref:TonB-dependent receptor n=1 Tax=Novosphingobium mangrovi (ex Huang et al. 2023) TaxID=2976432 RepID=A0ABT2I8L7_9SPHN|nr:TonB-dependent receptor [Novosphingobium mangrovi (ex Huang et al. 2023)]MCT2401159.1 TonB-dependent receptor [Novosphingobium mangrovi (ex Huang et al. 2023)]